MTSECTACIRAAFKRDFWKKPGILSQPMRGGGSAIPNFLSIFSQVQSMNVMKNKKKSFFMKNAKNDIFLFLVDLVGTKSQVFPKNLFEGSP